MLFHFYFKIHHLLPLTMETNAIFFRAWASLYRSQTNFSDSMFVSTHKTLSISYRKLLSSYYIIFACISISLCLKGSLCKILFFSESTDTSSIKTFLNRLALYLPALFSHDSFTWICHRTYMWSICECLGCLLSMFTILSLIHWLYACHDSICYVLVCTN